MGRRDHLWLAFLTASFVFGIAVSWERWAGPVIDSGREMNQPLRLVAGEVLYSDVGHIYGPLSPWIHARLYGVFGPSLTVLYVDGIICAVAILSLVYWIARRIMAPAGAGAATLTVMWLCTFKPAGNYIFPYAYSALHATLLGLVTLAVLTVAVNRPTTVRLRSARNAARPGDARRAHCRREPPHDCAVHRRRAHYGLDAAGENRGGTGSNVRGRRGCVACAARGCAS
jgi:hypothetical protein